MRRNRSVDPLINLAFIRYRTRELHALFSGGDDSLVATHIASLHPRFTGVLHLDTGTGIPETREFVIDTCKKYGWPLTIETPDSLSYRDLVLKGHKTKDGRVLRGFPYGISSHNTMYYYLKQRSLQRFVRQRKRVHDDHIALVTGIRINESLRRMRSVLSMPISNHGAMVWLNPILKWNKPECLRYLEQHNISRNPVSVNLHRSGECLCGALANPPGTEGNRFLLSRSRAACAQLGKRGEREWYT